MCKTGPKPYYHQFTKYSTFQYPILHPPPPERLPWDVLVIHACMEPNCFGSSTRQCVRLSSRSQYLEAELNF